MAKPTTVEIKLESTAGTGTFYVTKKNPRTKTEKMKVRKYDKKARKHDKQMTKSLMKEFNIKKGDLRIP